jgi:hypothetical protein
VDLTLGPLVGETPTYKSLGHSRVPGRRQLTHRSQGRSAVRDSGDKNLPVLEAGHRFEYPREILYLVSLPWFSLVFLIRPNAG